MAIIAQASIDQVKAAADMVGDRSDADAAPEGRRALDRPLPFHEERTPSFSVNAADKLFYCFGCGMKGDLITFVKETEGLDFVGAIGGFPSSTGPLAYEETSPQAEAKRERRALSVPPRAGSGLLRAQPLGVVRGRAGARRLAGRGLGEEVCRAYRLGLAGRSRAR